MSKPNFLDLLKGTIDEIQNQNRTNPNEPTTDPSVFDWLKDKLGEVDQKSQTNIQTKEGKNVSIFDILKDKLESARSENQSNPAQPTASGSIFDKLKKQIEQQQNQSKNRYQRRAEESISDLIQKYNINVSGLNNDILQQIQNKYVEENNELDVKFANFIHQTAMQARGGR